MPATVNAARGAKLPRATVAWLTEVFGTIADAVVADRAPADG